MIPPGGPAGGADGCVPCVFPPLVPGDSRSFAPPESFKLKDAISQITFLNRRIVLARTRLGSSFAAFDGCCGPGVLRSIRGEVLLVYFLGPLGPYLN